jgi:hypothetical protein
MFKKLCPIRSRTSPIVYSTIQLLIQTELKEGKAVMETAAGSEVNAFSSH